MSKLIGLGAAGNKAVIEAIERGFDRTKCLLINSTLKDIPAEYHDISTNIGGQRGGCGKERNVSKELTVLSFRDGSLELLSALLDDRDETVFLVTSTEGGTGSGSTPLIAKYFKEMFEINVNIIAITGFEDDSRGLLNTIEFFKELSDEFTVQTISNKKFLKETNGNKVKAQILANEEFAKRIKIALGGTIVDSDNNIDETDLYKVLNTPGYLMIDSIDISNIKNKDQYNAKISEMLDTTHSIDSYSKSMKRLAIILDISENIEDAIDYDHEVLKQRLGVPFEVYPHIQSYREESTIEILAAGMDLPIEELQEIHKKYLNTMENVKRDKDSFFDSLKTLGDKSAKEFDSARRTTKMQSTEVHNKKLSGFLDNILDDESDEDSVDDVGSKY